MLRRLRPPVLALALILSTTAATSSDSFDVRVLLATLGLGTIVVGGRYVWARDRGLLAFESDVMTALWGPRDGNGMRDVQHGIVAIVNRLAGDIPRSIDAATSAAQSAREAATAAMEAAAHAATAADAARQAQTFILERGFRDRAD